MNTGNKSNGIFWGSPVGDNLYQEFYGQMTEEKWLEDRNETKAEIHRELFGNPLTITIASIHPASP